MVCTNDGALIDSLDFCRQVTPLSGKYWKLHSAVQSAVQGAVQVQAHISFTPPRQQC